MTVLTCLFWLSIGLIGYSYVGYPIVLMIAVRMKRWSGRDRKSLLHPPAEQTQKNWPFVSLIIAAYKEEDVILQRISNALLMDYPADRLEILIGCDGDEDGTGELVRSINDPRVRLLQFPQRRGKPSVLNDCVAEARGEILAFSDANTFWERNALKTMVMHFQQENVGGVCGHLQLVDAVTGQNVDGLYWKYENLLKLYEGELGTLLGFNGAIYTMRKTLWQPLPSHALVDDFLIGMRIHLQRRSIIFDHHALATEESAPSVTAEFQRRCRIGAGGFQSLGWLWSLLSPTRGDLAVAFWSHKLLRWLCPLFMLTAFVTNLALIQQPFYAVMFSVQVLLYGCAWIGQYIASRNAGSRVLQLTTMFVSMNVALAVGFWRCLKGRQSGTWARTVRTAEKSRRVDHCEVDVRQR